MKVDPDAFDPLACRPVLSEPQTVDDKENPFIADVHAGPRNLKSGGGMEAILDAARAAKQQTDPARYARHIEQELDKTIGRILDRLDILHSSFEADRCNAAYRLEDLVEQEENTLQRLRADQERAGRWKKRIPFIALFGLVLVFGLAIALPRILADSGFGCDVIGGEWLRGPESGKQACVFYAE